MEDVAERAGVSRATLYLHFRSRLELVDSICDVVGELYGVVAVDPAAKDFVERQTADRRGELQHLARNLRRSGRLQLRDAGMNERDAARLLLETAQRTLFDG
jgi:AcrR family transcriptional regulator